MELVFSMGIDGDIFQLCKDGQLMKIKQWLDNTENDLNQGDDHWFTPLHWASRNGRIEVVELLISRGMITVSRLEFECLYRSSSKCKESWGRYTAP